MITRRLLALAWALLALPASQSLAANPAPPSADCTATVQPVSNSVRIVYDPFEGQQQIADLDVEISRGEERGCDFELSVTGNGSSRERKLLGGSGTGFGYEIKSNGGVVQNDLNSAFRIQLNNGEGNGNGVTRSRIVRLRFSVAARQFGEAGEYEDRLMLRLFEKSSGMPRQVGADLPVLVTAIVPPRAQVNFAGASSEVFGSMSAGGIDFGELRTGAQKDAFIQVRATSPVQLTFSSFNSGRLRHKVTPGATAAIPYTILIDSEPLALEKGRVTLARKLKSGLEASNYRFAVRIDDADNRIAGTYEDVVTITVEPR